MSSQDNLNLGEFKRIDLAEALRMADGDLTLLQTVAGMLADQIAEDLPVLQLHCANKDSVSLVRSAHRLKGSLSYFGIKPAYEACVRLESLAAENAAEEYDSVMIQLTDELNRMMQELVRLTCVSV